MMNPRLMAALSLLRSLAAPHNGRLVNWPFDSDAHPPAGPTGVFINEAPLPSALRSPSAPRVIRAQSEVGVCFCTGAL